MKLRNYFFGALACLALASCSSDDDAIDSGQEGKDGVACIAVKITMPGGNTTRAWNDDDTNTFYKEGETEEVMVNNAWFYFFDSSKNKLGAPQEITTVVSTDGRVNTIDKIISEGTTSDPVGILLLEDPNTIPSYIVAVLNVPEDQEATLSDATNIDNLSKVIAVAGLNSTTGFVMSNSVYISDGTAVQATAISEDNIGIDVDASIAAAKAKENPVIIPVERMLARINVKSSTYNTAEANLTNTDIIFNGDLSDTKIRPVILGWWLDNTYSKSYLIKQLENTYSFTQKVTGTDVTTSLPEPWWNDPVDFRSYWAEPATDGTYGHYTWGSANNNDKYCYENTKQTSPTQIVVAARLTDGTKPVDLVQWTNFNFKSASDFKAFMIDYLDNFKKVTGGSATKLTAEDFELRYNYYNTSTKMTVKISYTADGSNKELANWQTILAIKKPEAGTTITKDGAEVEYTTDGYYNLISEVGIFKYYYNGQTYYYTAIDHEPKYIETEHAVIRNHYYTLSLTGITGLGTPVPNPDDDPEPNDTPDEPTVPEFPDPTDPNGPDDPDDPDPTDPDQPIIPEIPSDAHSAISAKVNILKYRVVSQSVNLGQ